MQAARPPSCNCSARPSQPVLLLLKGQPGSGKSHLGRALCRHLRWPLIDKDLARSPCQPLVAGHLGIDWNQLSYDIMFSYCEAQLACGLSAVLDCPLARRSLYDRAAKLAAKHGARVALVELEPSDWQLWRQRVEQRGAQERGTEHEHKPGSWADVQTVLARNGGSEEWSAAPDIGLDLRCRLDSTGCSTEQQLQQVVSMLRSGDVLQCGGDEAAAEAAVEAVGGRAATGS